MIVGKLRISNIENSRVQAVQASEKAAQHVSGMLNCVNLSGLEASAAYNLPIVAPKQHCLYLSKDSTKKILDRIFSQFPEELTQLVEAIDQNSAILHLENITKLKSIGIKYFNNIIKNGHFSSRETGENCQKVLKRFPKSARGITSRSSVDVILHGLNQEDIKKLIDRKILDIKELGFSSMIDLAKLSDAEWSRLQASGLIQKKINYASENQDINDYFVFLTEKLMGPAYLGNKRLPADTLKLIENTVLTQAENKPQEVKEILESIRKVNNYDEFMKVFLREKDVDLKLRAQIMNRVENAMIKAGIPVEPIYPFSFSTILGKVNKHNIELIEEITSTPEMNEKLICNALEYAHDESSCKQLKEIMDSIRKGEADITAMPIAKGAKVNSRAVNAKNAKVQLFDAGTPVSKICGKTIPGEVIGIGKNAYINSKGKLEKLDISIDMYQKLFPEYETIKLQQSRHTGDCYLLTALAACWKNPDAKAGLLKMFKEVDGDIILTIPGYKDYPAVFKNGGITEGTKHAKSSAGMLMLEETYAKARYLFDAQNYDKEYLVKQWLRSANWQDAAEKSAAKHLQSAKLSNNNSANIEADHALEYINGGFPHDVFSILLGKTDAKCLSTGTVKIDGFRNIEFVTKKQLEKTLDSYANAKNRLLVAGSETRDNVTAEEYGVMFNHAYLVEKIDSKNKKVELANPYNTTQLLSLTYEQFLDNFPQLFVAKIR